MRTECADGPSPPSQPPGDSPAARSEPVDHHVEELLLAFRKLERTPRPTSSGLSALDPEDD